MTHIHTISIGEPWDFSSPDGPNVVKGIIVKTIDPHCLVFKTPYKLEFKGEKGDTFILFPRHGSFEHIEEKGGVIVNIGLFLGSDIDNKSPAELEKNALFVMIGTIKK